MTDTVETLRTDLDALRAEFQAFMNYAKPVIDGHQPSSLPEYLRSNPDPVSRAAPTPSPNP